MAFNFKEVMSKPERLAPGHRMCAGCGGTIAVRTVLRALHEGDKAVIGNATGCLEVSTFIYPHTAYYDSYIHTAFANAAATCSGVEAAYNVLKKKGKVKEDFKFITFGGDGGTYDIGLQSLSGAMERGHDMVYVCYDNGAYMNTGIQRSSATPMYADTTTTPVGKQSNGKMQNRKDLASMEVKNLLKRTYGGAVRPDTLHPGHNNIVSTRKDKNIKEKQQIAKKAVKLIRPGDMIFLDISTTNIELAKEIQKQELEITVISCMMDIAQIFSQTKKVKFILLGGEFNRAQNGFLGELTIQMMKKFRFDACFMGVVGADVQNDEIMTYVPEDGIMKSYAMKRSRRRYLVMENCKFDFKANYVYTTFEDVDGILCEEKPSKKISEKLKEYQVEVIE